jgi:hypothetical protein
MRVDWEAFEEDTGIEEEDLEGTLHELGHLADAWLVRSDEPFVRLFRSGGMTQREVDRHMSDTYRSERNLEISEAYVSAATEELCLKLGASSWKSIQGDFAMNSADWVSGIPLELFLGRKRTKRIVDVVWEFLQLYKEERA